MGRKGVGRSAYATRPSIIVARQKAAKALEMRKAGFDYETIAAHTGYNSKQAAHDAVKRAMGRLERPDATEIRDLDLARLDALLPAVYIKGVATGDKDAIMSCLKILERRARMLGLDVPVRTETEHSGKVEYTPLPASVDGLL